MLQSIKINGFRKYESFELKDFNGINFFLGDNNVGKTTILEAIFTWACGQNVVPMLNIPMGRGRYALFQNQYWMMEEILAMFHNRHNLPLEMSFEGVYNNEKEDFLHTIYPSDLLTDYDSSYKNSMDKIIPRSNEQIIDEQQRHINMQLFAQVTVAQWNVTHRENTVHATLTAPSTLVPNTKPFVNAKYIDILSHTAIAENVQMYASLKREGLMNEVVNKMSSIFPEIVGFDLLPYLDGSQATVSVIKRDGITIPMYSFGDGVQRWFYIIGALTIYRNAILCIDEIDVGLHPNAQVEFCKSVSKYSLKNNVQLFITTHNIEFVESFLKAIREDKKLSKAVNVYTIRENDGKTISRALSAEEADKLRSEYNMELR